LSQKLEFLSFSFSPFARSTSRCQYRFLISPQVFIVLALAAVALADTPRPAYPPPPPPPAYKPAPSYKEPSYADVPPQYNYQYAVKDDYAGVDFGKNLNYISFLGQTVF